MRLSRKHQFILVAAAALSAALIIFGPSLYLGLLKYIPALAINRGVAAFVAKHDHLTLKVILPSALIWYAGMGWKFCHKTETTLDDRPRWNRWFFRLMAWSQRKLVRLFRRPITWLNRHRRIRLGVLGFLGIASLIIPMGAIVGSLMARYWKAQVWMKVSAISVTYTLSNWLTQQGASHLIGRPHPYQHYLMYGIYAVAAYLIAGKWAKRQVSRLRVRTTYRTRFTRLRWALARPLL